MDDEQEAIAAAGGRTMSEAAERALDTVIDAFGERYAGAFFDVDGALVALLKDLDPDEGLSVTSRLALHGRGIRLASAPYSEFELESYAQAIADNENESLSGISFDVQRSQVVLHTDRSLSGSELAELLGEVPADAVRVDVGEVHMQW